MDSQQYQIPGLLHEASAPELSQEADHILSYPKSPEVRGNYKTYKQIEQEIEKLRETATEDMLPNPGFSESILNRLMTPRPFIERLIDAESKIGGDLLPQSKDTIRQRFFYYQGYWYLEITDQQGAMVASYQLTDDMVYKFYGGKPIAFDDTSHELDNLLTTIPLYENAVKELYKSDFDLAA